MAVVPAGTCMGKKEPFWARTISIQPGWTNDPYDNPVAQAGQPEWTGLPRFAPGM